MKIRAFMMAVMVSTVALLLGGCTTTPSISNSVRFDIGDTVGQNTKYQFISITSEQAWSITIEYLAPEGESNWCTLSKTSGEGNDNILMTFGENTLNEERSLNVVVQFAREQITLLFTQRSADSQPSESDLSGWLELPAFEADGERTYFSKHMLPSSNNTKRSFSLLYDSDIYHSHWIAYPLYRDVIGSGNRTDDWGIFDPNIPTDKQLYMKSSYQGSYDRGHMLPSASRAKTRTDNSPTFYPTNMSPQLAGLNQKKWAGIEGQVRSWAEGCDTLYVVTGAVFKTVGGNESVSYTYCKSDSSKDVAVPNYYYKALLQRRGTGDSSTYQALAIWVPHKAAEGSATMDDIITIDQLEERTGMDFFVNLDEETQQKVESSVNSKFWGL